jgi:parallel beta-helix repeat protein
MKTLLSVLVVLCVLQLISFINSPSYAATTVGGDITTNTTWSLSGSPYIVISDVTVVTPRFQSLKTLTIEPGVEVRFDPGTQLILGGLRFGGDGMRPCDGVLRAIGTAENPIVFTSNSSTPAPGDWKGIYFTRYSTGTSSELDYCVVEYGGNEGTAGVQISGPSPSITNSSIKNNGGNGIYINANVNPTLTGNDISSNLGNGIYVTALDARPGISGNILSNNGLYPLNLTPNATNNCFVSA